MHHLDTFQCDRTPRLQYQLITRRQFDPDGGFFCFSHYSILTIPVGRRTVLRSTLGNLLSRPHLAGIIPGQISSEEHESDELYRLDVGLSYCHQLDALRRILFQKTARAAVAEMGSGFLAAQDAIGLCLATTPSRFRSRRATRYMGWLGRRTCRPSTRSCARKHGLSVRRTGTTERLLRRAQQIRLNRARNDAEGTCTLRG